MIPDELEPVKYVVDEYDFEDDCDDEDDDDDTDNGNICPTCNGSGEGMYDGTTCPTCHGR